MTHSPSPDADATPPPGQLRLGPFLVAPGGRLSVAPGERPHVTVLWQDRRVSAVLRAAPSAVAADGRLALSVPAGMVPSSIGAPDAAARRDAVFAALRALPPYLPDGWGVALRPDHQVCLATVVPIALPISAFDFIAALAAAVHALTPALAMLDACGCAPPADPAARPIAAAAPAR